MPFFGHGGDCWTCDGGHLPASETSIFREPRPDELDEIQEHYRKNNYQNDNYQNDYHDGHASGSGVPETVKVNTARWDPWWMIVFSDVVSH